MVQSKCISDKFIFNKCFCLICECNINFVISKCKKMSIKYYLAHVSMFKISRKKTCISKKILPLIFNHNQN